MLRGFRRRTRLHGLTAQTRALEAAGCKTIYDEHERDELVNSMRKGDLIVVQYLSVLATDKGDLRWVLVGEDKKTGYKGAFKRGAGIRDLELEQAGDLHDMQHVEATLRATEDWARERQRAPRPGTGKRGKRGRKPKKKTDKHTAMIAWGDRKTYPEAKDALASPYMKGWSHSAAARPIDRRGLGPRGGLTGRLSKQIVQN